MVERLKNRLGKMEEKNYTKPGHWKYSSHTQKRTHWRPLEPHQMNKDLCFWNSQGEKSKATGNK